MTQTSGHCFHPSVGQSLSSGAEMCMNFANITIALEGEQDGFETENLTDFAFAEKFH